MPRIDIDEVLREKAPRFAKYIPRFVRNWLRRTIHEEALNDILAAGWNRPPQEFIHVAFERMRIAYRIDGLERLDPAERYLFVANHPFGGLDGMMIADALIERFGDAGVGVNDLRLHVEPRQPIWVPFNPHGRQTAAYARRYDEAFAGDLPILTFPAGLCSRCIDGEVTDPEWKISFLKKAYASQRQIVPVFVEGELSKFFYRVYRIRKALGIKFNIEMLWLPDEMFRQGGSRFRIVAGDPIVPDGLRGTLRQQADTVRGEVYRLKEKLPCTK